MKCEKPTIIALIATIIIGVTFAACSTNQTKRKVYTKSIPPIKIVMPICYDEPIITPTIAAEQPTRPVVTLPSRKAIISLPLPKGSDGSFKSYTDYRKITRQSSQQWHLRQIATTDADGMRKIGEYFCIAIAQYYSNTIGETFTIVLPNRTFKVIIADVKRIEDTIDNMYCKENGSIIEFHIDSTIMTHEKLQKLFSGKIISIVKEK